MHDADAAIAPLSIAPRFVRRVWGGDRLAGWLDRAGADAIEVSGPEGEPIGECWLAGDGNRVRSGPHAGRTLGEVADVLRERLVGSVAMARYGARVPLLAKVLDAAADLSVQVHPDDAYALRFERATGHLGKSEAWYVLDAAPDAAVLWGFRHDVDAATVRRAVEAGSLPALMHRVAVRPGDVVWNPAGTVHAIGAGVLAFEIQQASDLTYRLYDYGRLAADGRPRDLHLERALAVADLRAAAPRLPQPRPLASGWRRLVEAPEFVMDARTLSGTTVVGTTSLASLELLVLLSGEARLVGGADTGANTGAVTDDGAGAAVGDGEAAALRLGRGATVVLPAALGAYRLEGCGEVLRCAVVKGEG